MLLAIDAGNTNTVLGLYRLATDESPVALIRDWRITTPLRQTLDEIGVTLRSLFLDAGHDLSVVDGIVISSVVPPIDSTLRRGLRALLQRQTALYRAGCQDRHSRADR